MLKWTKNNCCFNELWRRHEHGCDEDICSGITMPQFHLLFYIKTFVGAETYFKKALAMTLEKNGLKDCSFRLCSVTYLELCLQMEIANSSSTLRISSDRMSMISTTQVTFDLGCQYKVFRELQRENYSPFKVMDDTERFAHLCNKLLQLQKSDAIFKESIVVDTDILMRGFGTIEDSHHSNTLNESGLGMFHWTMLLFRMCWSTKHEYLIETILSIIQICLYFSMRVQNLLQSL